MNNMTNNAIVHFEIPADDVVRAKEFYQKSFGWTFSEFPMPEDSSTGGEPYYGVITTPMGEDHMPTKPGEINGGLMKRMQPGQPMMSYLNVDDIDAALEAVEKNGGHVCMPKTEIAPGMGWIACFNDTEGNMLGMHQRPATPPQS